MPDNQIQSLPPENEPNPSTANIRARGDISLRTQVLRIVWSVLGALLIIAGLILFKKPEFLDEYLNRVLPIISGAIFGMIGFATGQKSKGS
jgi:uncharacterized membrane-anchored protein